MAYGITAPKTLVSLVRADEVLAIVAVIASEFEASDLYVEFKANCAVKGEVPTTAEEFGSRPVAVLNAARVL